MLGILINLGVDLKKYSIESVELTDIKSLEKNWITLQEQADCSFFQSWSWIGVWLAKVVDELSLQLITIHFESDLIGLGVFVSTKVTRHHIIKSRSMFLNEAPFSGNNMVIEYNGLLVARGHESKAYAQVIPFLMNNFPTVDEFYFGAMKSVDDIAKNVGQGEYAVKYICQQDSPTWLVKLDDLGGGVDAYLATLGKNRRLQIKRSLRLYNEVSTVQVEEAESVEQALNFFDGLKKLHTKRWHSIGKAGSFANARWEVFHRALIASCYDKGEIQLLKISNMSGEIAYLYNFIWRQRVYVLQTGFAMFDDKRLMPGYVAHTLAIIHNKNKGMTVYDLMNGDALYKKLLCDHNETLYWSVIQRKRYRFAFESAAGSLIRNLRKVID